jgi:hypothetical protein
MQAEKAWPSLCHCKWCESEARRTNDVLKYLEFEIREDESKIASTKGDVLLQASKPGIGHSSVQE